MSTKTIAYEQKLPEITAIAREDVKKPSMPMDVYLQEANNVYHWAKADLEELQKAGFSADLLEDLPVRCDAASEAQSLWHNVMRSQEQAQQQWSLESPEAYALRDEILHTMRYAFRNNESKLTKVRSVAEGNSDADMIQDLNDLAIIGREMPELLTAVGYDVTKLEQAAELSRQMSQLKAAATTDKAFDREKKYIRDQAYTHLKEAVDEVRECGQFVFWKNETRRRGYISDYIKKMNSSSTAKSTESVEENSIAS